MYWQFNDKQKKWIRRLLRSGKTHLEIRDVLEEDWPAGQLEINTFQQKLVIHLDEKGSQHMDDIIVHIMEICDLFRQLEEEHLIRSWNELPNEDNTEWIGEKKDEAIPHFLPDIGVAAEMLKWFGKKIQVKDGLVTLVERNFKDQTQHHAILNRRIMILGFLMVGLVILFNGFYFRRVMDNRINDLQDRLILSQQQGHEGLDSLKNRLENLYDLSYRMATDSQQEATLKVVVDAVDRSVDQMNRKSSGLEARIKENQKMLKSNDSLLRKLSVDR